MNLADWGCVALLVGVSLWVFWAYRSAVKREAGYKPRQRWRR